MPRNRSLSEVVLEAGKTQRDLYAMLKNNDPDRTPEERDSMWRCYEDRMRRGDKMAAIEEKWFYRVRKGRRYLGKGLLVGWRRRRKL